MNRAFYIFGIFFLALLAAVGLFQSIIHFQLDNQIFALESLDYWLLVVIAVSTIASLFLLKYFHFKKYDFAFYSGIIFTMATFFYLVVLYRIIAARELEILYMPMVAVVFITTIVHSISLIISPAGTRVWLRAAGICLLAVNLVLSLVLILSFGSVDFRTQEIAREISQWASLFNQLLLILFIMNFDSERKNCRREQAGPPLPRNIETTLTFLSFSAFVATLAIGVSIAAETHSKIYWTKRNLAHAQEISNVFEARTYVSSKGETLQYRILRPLDYDPQKKYPLVVCLHHGGVHGSDNVKQLSSEPAPILSSDPYRKQYPAFLFAPQSPLGAGFGRQGNYPSVDSLVFETIYALEQEFSIDEKKRYVMGISGGGFGSWHFITMHPEMFAAAVPICGGGNPDLAGNIVDVDVWAFHGEKDNLVPVKLSRDMIEGIKKAGGDPRYTEFEGEGHNIWGRISPKSGELFEWMFAQQRD